MVSISGNKEAVFLERDGKDRDRAWKSLAILVCTLAVAAAVLALLQEISVRAWREAAPGRFAEESASRISAIQREYDITFDFSHGLPAAAYCAEPYFAADACDEMAALMREWDPDGWDGISFVVWCGADYVGTYDETAGFSGNGGPGHE